jgi:capsular exopolysaccharide family
MKRVTIVQDALDYHVDEAFRVLRTNLQFCGEDKRVIAVTSSIPGEGKSNTSLRLAISLAEVGKKVVLVDADLRKSVLNQRMTVGEEIKGLSHYLSKQETLPNIVNSTNIDNLNLIVAGLVPPNPAELLNEEPFTKMIKVLRKVYDYIIIDTPPLGSVIDSAIIAEKCDGVILVIESGAVSGRFVEENIKQLEKSGCPILGAVLNKMNREQRGRYGKYYGRYGNKYSRYGEEYIGK